VWPTVNQQNLNRAFERLQQQEVSFEGCKINVNDARAEATCHGTASYVPRVGNRTLRVDRREWRFSMVKVREEWLIGAVEAR
jgi:Zn finger protein HypA/HybF involved in hydrogenase expression